ncbi:Uncharacterised protein [Yersinia pekkanenii]|uniref:Uncharacterized protein n=1 Tax=Yersinia pekkanenii TaxID=1288385 RepID=A0A0T9R8V4_9GAMM|nr:Uncharacterised protein [Yersinia pekkanenii]CRY68877.1 Uncharacterised protein [Yersinia pekkanenii]
MVTRHKSNTFAYKTEQYIEQCALLVNTLPMEVLFICSISVHLNA